MTEQQQGDQAQQQDGAEGELTAEKKAKLAEAFVASGYFKQVHEPMLKALILTAHAELMTCPISEVRAIRKQIIAYEAIREIPGVLIERGDMEAHFRKIQAGEASDGNPRWVPGQRPVKR